MTRNYTSIRLTQAAGICRIELFSPKKKNALSANMVNELIYALDDAQEDSTVRAIGLAGAEGNFCSGADLSSFSAEQALPMRGEFPDLLLRLLHSEKPIAAAVEGVAMGGALGLLACCHFVIAADNARFALPEIRRGFFPFMIMPTLTRVVKPRVLAAWMLLGEDFSSAAALEGGLVSHVVAQGELANASAALLDKLSAQSSTAMRQGLLALREQEGMAAEEAIPKMKEKLAAILSTADAQEGVRAFMEKRAPIWPSHTPTVTDS